MSLNMEACTIPGMCKVAPTPVSVNAKTVPRELSVCIWTMNKVHQPQNPLKHLEHNYHYTVHSDKFSPQQLLLKPLFK